MVCHSCPTWPKLFCFAYADIWMPFWMTLPPILGGYISLEGLMQSPLQNFPVRLSSCCLQTLIHCFYTSFNVATILFSMSPVSLPYVTGYLNLLYNPTNPPPSTNIQLQDKPVFVLTFCKITSNYVNFIFQKKVIISTFVNMKRATCIKFPQSVNNESME